MDFQTSIHTFQHLDQPRQWECKILVVLVRSQIWKRAYSENENRIIISVKLENTRSISSYYLLEYVGA